MAAIQDFVLRIKTEGVNQLNNLRKGVDGLTSDLQSLASVGGPLSNTIGGIVGKLGPLGLGAAAAGGAFVALGMKAIALADELSDVSDATGIAAGSLNNFRNSLVDAGGKTEDFSTLAAKLNQNLGDAAVGNEKAQDAFKKLGVFVRDANGAVRNTGDVLRDAISKLAAIEDPAKRASLAVDIFGKTANKLDFTKLNAANDFVKDEQIAQLAKYQTAIDAIAKSVNDSLLASFGKLAISIREAQKQAQTAEEEANARGKTRLAQPGTAGAALGLPLGLGVLDLERKLTPEEISRLELAKKLAEAYKDINRENDLLNKKNKKITLGDFGADSEAKIKAAAASRMRLATSSIEEEKNQRLQAANEIQAIEINAQSELRKAANTIYAQERLSNLQMDKEYAAKKLEVESKTALDISKVRSQQNAKIFSEEESQRQKIQDELAAEDERLKKLFETGRKITEQAAEQNRELSAKFKLALDSVMLTDRERANAEELFKIEQDRLALLKQIADTYGDSEFAKRTAEEKKINELIAQRRTDAVANQEATAKQQEDFGAGWQKAYRQYVENSRNGFNQAGAAFSTLSRGFEDSIVKFVQTGKLSFKDLFNDLIAQAVRAQSNKLLSSILGSLGGSFFGSLFGGGGPTPLGIGSYAMGGNPPVNRPSLIGENGPELFVPRSAGTIVPNGQFGGGGTVNNTAVTYSIQAVDAQSFKSLLARDPEFIHNVAEQGRRSMPIRSRR
jgi:lambda family phage tail tape measure protein